MPLMFLEDTAERLKDIGVERASGVCSRGGRDGISLARWLHATLSSLQAVLWIVGEAEGAPQGDCGCRRTLVWLGRVDHTLFALHSLLELLSGEEPVSWPEALAQRPPEELLGSGDCLAFWRDHFPGRFRASSAQFEAALQASFHRIDNQMCEAMRPWLKGAGDSGDVELVEAAPVLDNLGMTRGATLCARWQEQSAHAFIRSLMEDHESTTVADIAAQRQEQRSSVLLRGWSREALCGDRQLLRVLMALGASAICDCPGGLVLVFDDVRVAELLQKRSAAVDQLLAALGHENLPAPLAFEEPGDNSASAAIGEHIRRLRCARSTRSQQAALAHFKVARLPELEDIVRMLTELGARRRHAEERRVIDSSPDQTCAAVPLLKKAMDEYRKKDENVVKLKQQLFQAEEMKDEPGKIAKIREALQALAAAEEEREQHGKWLAVQRVLWTDEAGDFQRNLRKQDVVGRQRVASILTDCQFRLERREVLQAELSRIDGLMLDIEDRQALFDNRVHVYDRELVTILREDSAWHGCLLESMARIQEQARLADMAVLKHHNQVDRMRRVLDLVNERSRNLEELDALERRLDIVRSKQVPPRHLQ